MKFISKDYIESCNLLSRLCTICNTTLNARHITYDHGQPVIDRWDLLQKLIHEKKQLVKEKQSKDIIETTLSEMVQENATI